MNQQALVDLITELVDRDPDAEDRDGVGVILRGLNQLAGWVDARKVRCARRLQMLAAEGRSESAATVLLDESRHSGKEANATLDRERVCSQFPGLEDALEAGAVSADHLDALARLTKNLSDQDRCDLHARGDEIVTSATASWVSEFERNTKHLIDQIRNANRPDADVDELERQRLASHVKRWTDKATGLRMTLIGLDPLRDTTLHNLVDAHLARLRQDPANDGLTLDQLKAQAIVDAVSAGPGSVSVPEIVVHVDAATLCHGRHPDTMCETVDGVELPVGTVQRLCCDAVLQAVIINPDGTFDQLCAELRTANRQQRRALAALYSTCAHPHCTVGFSQCRIHHVVWFSHQGKTVLDNMLPLCARHHHLVHGGRLDAHDDPRPGCHLGATRRHCVVDRQHAQPPARPTLRPTTRRPTTRPATTATRRTLATRRLRSDHPLLTHTTRERPRHRPRWRTGAPERTPVRRSARTEGPGRREDVRTTVGHCGCTSLACRVNPIATGTDRLVPGIANCGPEGEG